MTDAYWAKIEAQIKEIEDTPMPPNFKAVLDHAAETYGDQIAINVFEDETALTYRQLQDQVMRIADGLAKLGIEKGTRIGVMLPNRIEYPCVWLAIGVLGAVMVPTNTAATSRELDYLYNDAAVDFVIIDHALMDTFQNMEERPSQLTDDHIVVVDCPAPAPYLDLDTLLKSGDPQFQPSQDIEAEDLINIQYTSGTTGLPKGCMQTQRYWIMLAHINEIFNSGIKSILSDHPFFYMDPQWQLLWGLRAGATIYSAKRMSTSRFMDWVQEFGIEYAFCSRPLLKVPFDPRDMTSPIKKFNAFGFSAELIKQAEARFGVPVRQAFGMTEVGAGMFVPDEIIDDEILDTCGIPAPFRECRVVDDEGRDVPTNTPGELVIRGDGIFKGYYNKPDANETSYFGDWFRTGDLFIKTEKGYYKIIGRLKDMIRRSSENISALEVEQVILEIPEVYEVAAVAVPDDYRGEEVKVYIRPKQGLGKSDIPPTKIIEHCQDRLAGFKVPRYLHYVDAFPYTPSQKIAKHKLIGDTEDLTAHSYDRVDDIWR